MKANRWLFALVVALCAFTRGGFAQTSVNYTIDVKKNIPTNVVEELKASFVSRGWNAVAWSYQLVDLSVATALSEPDAAASGEATTSVTVRSDDEVVVSYELGDIVVYDETSIAESALAGTNLTLADVNITVNSTFTVTGVIVVSNDYSATALAADIASDLGVPTSAVSVEENVPEGEIARRRLLQTTEKQYTVTVASADFDAAAAFKTSFSDPSASLNTVASRSSVGVRAGSSLPKIDAKIRNVFVSAVPDKKVREMFDEKLSRVSTSELKQRVTSKLNKIWFRPDGPSVSVGSVPSTVSKEVDDHVPVSMSLVDLFDSGNTTLTYAVSVNNHALTNASVDGSVLTITKKEGVTGTATITVTAYASESYAKNTMVQTSFTFSVYEDNPPYRTALALADQTDFATFDVAPYFDDPDGDTLIYEIVTDSSIVSATLDGTVLTVTNASSFDHTVTSSVTIIARDRKSQVQDSFNVTFVYVAPVAPPPPSPQPPPPSPRPPPPSPPPPMPLMTYDSCTAIFGNGEEYFCQMYTPPQQSGWFPWGVPIFVVMKPGSNPLIYCYDENIQKREYYTPVGGELCYNWGPGHTGVKCQCDFFKKKRRLLSSDDGEREPKQLTLPWSDVRGRGLYQKYAPSGNVTEE